jgi:hypothetical protein
MKFVHLLFILVQSQGTYIIKSWLFCPRTWQMPAARDLIHVNCCKLQKAISSERLSQKTKKAPCAVVCVWTALRAKGGLFDEQGTCPKLRLHVGGRSKKRGEHRSALETFNLCHRSMPIKVKESRHAMHGPGFQ